MFKLLNLNLFCLYVLVNSFWDLNIELYWIFFRTDLESVRPTQCSSFPPSGECSWWQLGANPVGWTAKKWQLLTVTFVLCRYNTPVWSKQQEISLCTNLNCGNSRKWCWNRKFCRALRYEARTVTMMHQMKEEVGWVRGTCFHKLQTVRIKARWDVNRVKVNSSFDWTPNTSRAFTWRHNEL